MTPIWAMGLMILCSVFSALGIFLFKQSSNKIELKFGVLLRLWKLWLGFFMIGMSTLLSLVAFKFGELSVLYPFVGLQYIWTSVLSVKYLAEKMGWKKWTGIVLIVFGVVLIGLGA